MLGSSRKSEGWRFRAVSGYQKIHRSGSELLWRTEIILRSMTHQEESRSTTQRVMDQLSSLILMHGNETYLLCVSTCRRNLVKSILLFRRPRCGRWTWHDVGSTFPRACTVIILVWYMGKESTYRKVFENCERILMYNVGYTGCQRNEVDEKILGGHDHQRRVDTDGDTLNWCKKCMGYSIRYLEFFRYNPRDIKIDAVEIPWAG